MKNRRSLITLGTGLVAILSFLAPVFPAGHVFITGNQAVLACGLLGWPCPLHPGLSVPSDGYASATYLLFGIGTHPDAHYPVNTTVYSTTEYPNGSSHTTAHLLMFPNPESVCLIVNATYMDCA